MNRMTGRLKPVALDRLSKNAGMHCDGGGLYLCVVTSNARSWVYRFMLSGKARTMGLGSYPEISLADARELANEARKLRALGVDPIAERDTRRAEEKLAAAKSVSFDSCRDQFIESHKAGWKNAKHQDQWRATLSTYVTPIFGSLPVQDIDTALVMKALDPIWATKPETASRVRGRIENVIDWATARGYRKGDNPARWRGHLDKLLPKRSKVRAVKHHPALPYAEISEFMRDLVGREATAARALEFTILTASRSGEVLLARPEEINFSTKIWTVPPERMKAGREHRVPLSDAAMKIVRAVVKDSNSEFLFPSEQPDQPLSNMAMLMMLRRMDRADVTAHGFRATFKTWASECSSFPSEVVEAALAHIVGDKVEAAYQRGDFFEKRRRLMNAWAEFCSKRQIRQPNVIPMQGARA